MPINRTLGPVTTSGEGVPVPTPRQRTEMANSRAVPFILPKTVPGPNGGLLPDQGPAPTGFTPIQVQTAYGINALQFPGGVPGDGVAGQTIAVIDVGNNPGFQPTGPKYAGSDLQVFDQTFGLPDPPTFGMYNQTGGTTLPGPVKGWGSETALDIEWAHAMAPLANLEVVEASSSFGNGLFQAAETAVTKLGASVVSMSFGLDYAVSCSGSLEQLLDQMYFQPACWPRNPFVTFLASTGDSGRRPWRRACRTIRRFRPWSSLSAAQHFI